MCETRLTHSVLGPEPRASRRLRKHSVYQLSFMPNCFCIFPPRGILRSLASSGLGACQAHTYGQLFPLLSDRIGFGYLSALLIDSPLPFIFPTFGTIPTPLLVFPGVMT